MVNASQSNESESQHIWKKQQESLWLRSLSKCLQLVAECVQCWQAGALVLEDLVSEEINSFSGDNGCLQATWDDSFNSDRGT